MNSKKAVAEKGRRSGLSTVRSLKGGHHELALYIPMETSPMTHLQGLTLSASCYSNSHYVTLLHNMLFLVLLTWLVGFYLTVPQLCGCSLGCCWGHCKMWHNIQLERSNVDSGSLLLNLWQFSIWTKDFVEININKMY